MRRLSLAVALVALAGLATASDYATYEQLTVADTAIGITAAVRNPPGLPAQTHCQASLEVASIRFRDDTVDPTASVGELVHVGETLLIASNDQARVIRFIRTGSTSGVLNVRCYR